MTLYLLDTGCDVDDSALKKAAKAGPGGRALAIDSKSICWPSNLGEKDALDDRAF